MNHPSQGNTPSIEKYKQYILLDTNVVSDFSDKQIGSALFEYITDLSKRGFVFGISKITIYEIMSGLPIKKERKAIELLELFTRFDITEEVIVAIARLDSLFKLEKIDTKSVDLGDKIISSTAILTGALILTSNAKDYPWPYFHEVEHKPIFYDNAKKSKRCHMLALITPDFDHIVRRFNERP